MSGIHRDLRIRSEMTRLAFASTVQRLPGGETPGSWARVHPVPHPKLIRERFLRAIFLRLRVGIVPEETTKNQTPNG